MLIKRILIKKIQRMILTDSHSLSPKLSPYNELQKVYMYQNMIENGRKREEWKPKLTIIIYEIHFKIHAVILIHHRDDL